MLWQQAPSQALASQQAANGNRMATQGRLSKDFSSNSRKLCQQRAVYSPVRLFCEAQAAAVSNVRICNLLMAPRSVCSSNYKDMLES